MTSAGPVLYWTSRMTTGPHPKFGRPIAGLLLKPGDEHGIYVGVPVRMPRCYLTRAWQVIDHFYVKLRFGVFEKWVRVPLLQPLMFNLAAEPPGQLGGSAVCAAR